MRDAWWKLVVAAVGVVPAGLIVAAYLPPYETTGRTVERFSDEMALGQILNVYDGGGIALSLLAILLGATTMSEVVGLGTSFLLLSKTISRARILLIKYAVSAGILLSAAVAGQAMLLVAAVARGYPSDLLSASGVVLSTLLMWLGSLSVLGLTMMCSVVCGDTLIGASAAIVVAYLAFYVLPPLAAGLVRYDLFEQVAPLYSWTDPALYAGDGLAGVNFLSCVAGAGVLLLTPLWLFGRKAY